MLTRVTQGVGVTVAIMLIMSAAPSAFGAKKDINGVLQQLASDNGVVGEEATYLFNDKDRTVVVLDQASGDPGNGELSAGDVLRGSFSFESLQVQGGTSLQINNADANALFGRFELVISGTSTVDLGGGDMRTSISFAPGATLGGDTLFEVYQAPSVNFDGAGGIRDTADGGFTAVPLVTGATLYADIGGSVFGSGAGDARYNFLTTEDVGTDVTFANLASLIAGTTIANTTSVRLDVVGTGDPLSGIGASPIQSIGTFASGFEVEGSGSIIATGEDFFDSAATFQLRLTVIPTPAAAVAGLPLFGLLGLIRPRRQRG